ncbi:MAG: PAS domain S-box protein [Deltaproteobacteria bacterium]|nr:PAS domain S-box protein [Deltaproteobacteria bacterium]
MKIFKEPFNQKLFFLFLIFIIFFIAVLFTDYIICNIIIGRSVEFLSMDSKTVALLNQQQFFGMFIKAGIGVFGLVAFLIIAKQMLLIVSDREQTRETLNEQNLKIIRKSIELSDVMRKFEDKNYDLEISRKELNHALSILKEKERDQRIIFDNSPLGIIRFDLNGEIKEFNDKFVELMGSKKEQLIGFNTARDSSPGMRKAIHKALNGEVAVFEDEYTSFTGGRTLALRVVFNPVDPGASPTQVIASVEDITQRKKAEQQLKRSHIELENLVREKTSELVREIEDRKSAHAALKKSEEKYRSILENIEDSYFELNHKGNLMFFNSSLSVLLGYSDDELKGLNYREIAVKDDVEKLFNVFHRVYMTGQTSQLIHCTFITKDNIRKNVGIITSLMRGKNGEPIGFQGLARDMTKQLMMENRMQQTRKMEAIGNLAGGVAHDFNNILGGIIGYTQLIKKHTPEASKVLPYVEQVLKASERAKGLVNQILLFSRKTESEKIPSDMGLIAKEVIKLLRASIPTTIEIKHSFKQGLSPIMADQTQIHQVFMNLCSNAAHAMEKSGGCLELKLSDIVVTKKTENWFEELLPGEYIKLSVSDTGHGMDRQIIEKIFDPYFTTKKIGAGTGLGLATVHGIVKDHNGVIQVKSKKGSGTVFHLFFPAVKKVIEKSHKPVEITEGNETILFVDDEIYLAEVGKEMLEDYGYEVESMVNSKQAFELFEKNPDRFDLVITDYTMPEMTGELLSRKIHEINPKVPIIMCTGISLAPEIKKSLEIEKILMKPVDMDDMLMIVRDILDKA